MDFLHCNACGHQPQFSESRSYFLSSCGHVFCQECSSRIQENCLACRQPCRLVQISADSPSAIKSYFKDPMDMFKANMQTMAQVMTFQKAQLKSFNHQFGKLLQQNKLLKGEMEKMKEENAQLIKKVETLQSHQQGQQRWIDHDSPRGRDQPFVLQQAIDPALNSLFTTGGQEIGNSINLPRGTMPNNNQGGDQMRASIGRTGQRVTLPPYTPAQSDRSSLMSRYSPTSTSCATVGGMSVGPFSPRTGASFSHYQLQTPTSRNQTPDIVSRLKKLRW